MTAPKDERRLTDGDFWDMAALDALRGVLGDPNVTNADKAAVLAAHAADTLLEERRKRREGGAT